MVCCFIASILIISRYVFVWSVLKFFYLLIENLDICVFFSFWKSIGMLICILVYFYISVLIAFCLIPNKILLNLDNQFWFLILIISVGIRPGSNPVEQNFEDPTRPETNALGSKRIGTGRIFFRVGSTKLRSGSNANTIDNESVNE